MKEIKELLDKFKEVLPKEDFMKIMDSVEEMIIKSDDGLSWIDALHEFYNDLGIEDQFTGTLNTLNRLQERKDLIKKLGNPIVLDKYDTLLTNVIYTLLDHLDITGRVYIEH